jgi:hypothetical protein
MRKLLLLLLGAALFTAGCPKDDDDDDSVDTGVVTPDSGVIMTPDFAAILAGLDFYVRNGCEACHCNAGEGGCNAGATRIIKAPYDSVDANLRFASTADEVPGADPWDPHPLKITGASNEDIANLTAYLGSLDPKEPYDGSDTLLAEGYQHYVNGTCIVCHLTSGQGSAVGAAGPPISGSNASAENLRTALSGGVPCHPLQCPRTMDPARCDPPPAETCSLLGRIETNATVELLTEYSDDAERARDTLAYFLSFISPPPPGGEVEECNNVSGQICTLAGNGIGGFTEDGSPADKTLLYYPQNLDITDWNKDGTRDLVIVDWNNHRIRVVYLDLEFTYGNPEQTGRNRMVTIAGDGKVTGTDALNHPTDITFDSDGDLMVSGWHNQNLYRYGNPANNGGVRPLERDQPIGICDLRCGFGDAPIRMNPLGLPVSIEYLGGDRYMFAENTCLRIRELTITGTPTYVKPLLCNDPVRLFEESAIRTVAGIFERTSTTAAGRYKPSPGYSGNDGPATEAKFNVFRGPTSVNFGIKLDPTTPTPERLYIADTWNNVIRYLDLTQDPITVHWFAGGTPCDNPMMQQTAGCNAGHRDGSAEDALFNYPVALWVHTDRSVYVVDQRNNAIRRIDFTTRQVTTVAGVAPRGGFNGDNIPATSALLNQPGGIAVHPDDGRIFIGDTNNNRIRVVVP